MPDLSPYGFRIVGPCTGDRRRIDWHCAFVAYAACDERARVEREAYLSAFTFADDFLAYLADTGSTKGFSGACWSPWIWFDLDSDANAGGLDAALSDTRTLCVQLCDRFAIGDDALLVFFSGSKGFHVGLPTAGFNPSPSHDFNRIARCFVENVAAAVGLTIDTGVYDKVRAFRAPNSRHGKTGRHKRRLTVDELLHLTATRIVELAAKPEPFDVPTTASCGFDLPAAWNEAAEQVKHKAEEQAEHRAAIANGDKPASLNRLTIAFIREGAPVGDRHRRLFSAAANMAEFGCPPPLAHALLTESALDCGVPPSDVRRQIDSGLASVMPTVRQVQEVFPDAEVVAVAEGGAT